MNKILIVDDNVMMRHMIINLFNDKNLEFDEAGDGIEGLSKISDNSYDLVITDIIMPKMEGIEMIRMAKKQCPDLKIIAISGGSPYYLYLAKKLGVEGVFTKPLNHHHFLNSVSALLQSEPLKITEAN